LVGPRDAPTPFLDLSAGVGASRSDHSRRQPRSTVDLISTRD